jgi:hypothetical protein
VVSFAEERDGKAKALNRGLAEASGEIVIMTDANNILAPGSVRAAVRHFADDQIWAVAGRRGEIGSAYDRYEDLIRRLESRTGTVAAMNGEFMAIRRSLVPSWPTHVVNDDLWLLCQIVRQGGRVVYEPEAVSLEDALPAADEVRRRSRMGAGRVMLAGELADMPSGFRWRLISHKFGRLALPFLMLSALASSLSLGRQPSLRRAGRSAARGLRPRRAVGHRRRPARPDGRRGPRRPPAPPRQLGRGGRRRPGAARTPVDQVGSRGLRRLGGAQPRAAPPWAAIASTIRSATRSHVKSARKRSRPAGPCSRRRPAARRGPASAPPGGPRRPAAPRIPSAPP